MYRRGEMEDSETIGEVTVSEELDSSSVNGRL